MDFFKRKNNTIDKGVLIVDLKENGDVLLMSKAKDSIVAKTVICEDFLLSEEYVRNLVNIISGYLQEEELTLKTKINLILPDKFIFTDIMTVPAMTGKTPKSVLLVSLCGLYKNIDDLSIDNRLISKGKNQSLFFIKGIRKEYIKLINSIFTASKLNLTKVTYHAASELNWLNKMVGVKDRFCVLLDIDKKSTDLIFRYDGNIIGFTTLPFGHTILTKDMIDAYTLFDNDVAETVIRATYRRASRNKLAMEKSEDVINATDTPYGVFSIFVKTVLGYLRENFSPDIYGKASTIYVNMPDRYANLIELVNKEQEENDVQFEYIDTEKMREEKNLTDDEIDYVHYFGLFDKEREADMLRIK